MLKYYGSKVFVLSFALLLSGCGLFGKEKLQIDGERIDVIKESSDLRPDYDLKQYKIRLPQPYENTRWAQNGGNTLHLMGHLEARESLNKLWEESFGKGSSKRDFLLSTPVISNKVVFNIDREAVLSARLLENGKEIWHKRLKPLNKDDKTSSMKGAGLAEFNKKIYATTGFGYVFCVNMVDGEILWQKDLGLPIRIAPTVSENKVFVQTFDNTLVALDAVDGSELWKYKTDFDSTTLVGGAAPAYNPELDVVIAAFSNGELRAFKASTGTPLWGDMLLSRTRTNSLSNITAIKANPVIDGDKVFAVGNNSVLVAIDLRTGRRLWERELGSTNQPWISGEYLFILSNDFDLLAIEKNTGKIVWNTTIPIESDDKNGVFGVGPILAGNRLIVPTSNGYIFAVSPYTGEILNYITTRDGIELPPVMAQGITLFTTNDADMLAYQ